MSKCRKTVVFAQIPDRPSIFQFRPPGEVLRTIEASRSNSKNAKLSLSAQIIHKTHQFSGLQLGARSKLSTFVSAGVTRKAFDSSVHLTCAVSFTLLFLSATPQQSTRATQQLVNQKTKQHQTQIRNNKQQDKDTKIGPI